VVIALLLGILLQAPAQLGPALPRATEGDFVIKDYRFASGETLPALKIHYRTLGTPAKNAQGVVTNAVLIMHGTGGTGAQFAARGFAGELFLPGQPLDVTKYFLVMPDDIGHGQSSKPSDGLRATFPRYGYQDMLTAEYALLTQGLGVNHLRLVMGTSMGGMHTWLWGERWPEFMDALMPLASVPGQISGRNRVWRRIVIDDDVANWLRTGDANDQLLRARVVVRGRRSGDLLFSPELLFSCYFPQRVVALNL
jgi:homoserine O-acetyltransferase/O-succinyltransferase